MFSSIACCSTLNVLLENDVKNEVYFLEGVYTFQGFSNGMDYWVHADGPFAIWYNEMSSLDSWGVGFLSQLGSDPGYSSHMYSWGNTLEKKCLNNNEGNVWNWMFWDFTTYSYVETNDVYIKCVNAGNCK